MDFVSLVADRHRYAREWKRRTGGKVIGYFCTYVPEEIIYALGFLPVRVLGGHEPQDVVDTHICAKWCPFCRDCLAQALLGRYDYLDGLVLAHCCFHIQQAFDSWRRHLPLEYSHELYLPSHLESPSALACYAQEVAQFRASLEAYAGRRLTETDLERALAVYRRHRSLLREVYERRKAPRPPVTGMQAQAMVLSSMLMDKEEHNRLLEQALEEMPREDSPDGSLRLMLLGNENDHLELTEFIESLGATIVVDEQCIGSRYFWSQVPAEEDPMLALARRYLERPPCPNKDVGRERRRLAHILNLAREWRVRGAVITQQKFCDPLGFEIPFIQAALREQGIPSLVLELDVVLPLGQFRTRIEAFLETIELEV